MNITFLIGNGFDRALGLETGYWEFYEWYMKQPRTGLSKHVVKFRDEIDKYVTKKADAKPYWSDVEIGLAKHTSNFNRETVSEFLDCYDDVRDNLVRYLTLQEARLTDEVLEQIQAVFAKQIAEMRQTVTDVEKETLINICKGLTDGVHKINCVSFNYTNAVDRVWERMKTSNLGHWGGRSGLAIKLQMGDVVHAHGFVDRYPIFGTCDESLIENQELLLDDDFVAVMIKGDSLQESGETWRRDTEKMINNSNLICVFGMSLGETDSDYWKMIAKWLNADVQRHIIVFWRDKKISNVNVSVREKRSNTRNVREKLLKASDFSDEVKQSMCSCIHVVFNSEKMFYLPENQMIGEKDTGVQVISEQLEDGGVMLTMK